NPPQNQVSPRAVVDHHVERPGVEREQSPQLTGTNRSIGLIPTRGTPAPLHRPRAAPSPTRLQTLLTSLSPSPPGSFAGLVAIARGQTPDPIPNSRQARQAPNSLFTL